MAALISAAVAVALLAALWWAIEYATRPGPGRRRAGTPGWADTSPLRDDPLPRYTWPTPTLRITTPAAPWYDPEAAKATPTTWPPINEQRPVRVDIRPVCDAETTLHIRRDQLPAPA